MSFPKSKITSFLPLPYFLFIFFWIILCFFSFSQKDPNLTIYNYPIIFNLIEFINKFGYQNHIFSTIIFSILIISLFSIYLYLNTHKKLLKIIYIKRVILIVVFTGIFAYPFLSHDIFNYLFNAKMVISYNTNPHIHTALEFPYDPWTRFMHNTHTAAPYGKFFTLISLIPGYLGVGNFTLTFLLMKLLSISFFLFQAFIIYKILIKNNEKQEKITSIIFLFLLNPLFLIEIIINGHNDAIMIGLAYLSLYILNFNKISSMPKYILAGLSFISSVFVKYASIVLFPIYVLSKKIKVDFYSLAGVSLFLILFSRIGQTHAWYLFWSFSFLILSKYPLLRKISILLTLGALIRYIPFIYDNNYFPSQNYYLLFLPLFLLLPKKISAIIK